MILLDTHTFVWWVSDRSQLSEKALEALQAKDAEPFISTVAAWEIALLYKKERLQLSLPPTQFIEKAIRHHGIRELPITRSVALAAVALPDLHNDPFDRILVAEAMRHNCPLISKDSKIAAYSNIKTLW